MLIIKKDAYIMITQTGTKFSRVLQLFIHAPYNHASIALDENLESLYIYIYIYCNKVFTYLLTRIL